MTCLLSFCDAKIVVFPISRHEPVAKCQKIFFQPPKNAYPTLQNATIFSIFFLLRPLRARP